MILSTRALIAALSATTLTPLCGIASANSNFCGNHTTCSDMGVYNRSSALVTSVVITQEKTNGACTLDERTFTQNLSGTGGSSADGDGFTINANTSCKYKVKFKTTNGCTGDKTNHMTPSDFADKTYIELVNACGTLKARTR